MYASLSLAICSVASMSSEWLRRRKLMPDGVIGTLTMDDLSTLRKLSKPDAQLFLSAHTLSDEDMLRVSLLIGKDSKSLPAGYAVQVHDPTRRLWFCAAWLAGASWRQLARFHDIAPQTVMSVADRQLTSAERQPLRIKSQMSLESLDTYHKNFILNIDKLKQMQPQEVARWLLDNTELDND